MKKRLALLLSVAMLAASLAGCGGGSSSSGGSSDGGATGSGHKESLIIGTDADINNLDLQKQQALPTTSS